MRRVNFLCSVVATIALTAACGRSRHHSLSPAANDAGDTGAGAAVGEGGTGETASGAGGMSGTSGSGGANAGRGGREGGTAGNSATAGGAMNEGGAGRAGGSGGLATSGAGGGAGASEGGTAGVSRGGTGNGGMAGASSTPTLTSCATWSVETAPDSPSTIMLVDGGVLLSRPGGDRSTDTLYNASNVAMKQSGLTGDFDVVVSFEDFQPGDATLFQGPVLEAGAWRRESTGNVYQATGTVGVGDGNLAVIVPNDDTPIESLSPVPDSLVGASGSIEIARASGIMTVTLTVNNEKQTLSSTTPFNEDPLDFFMGIGLAGESQGDADASVKLTSVKVTGGGGSVRSDTFDCTL